MSQEQMILLMVKGTISVMPTEDQLKIAECANKLKATVAEYGDFGLIALGLVGAEAAAEAEP
jgi:hypothetical protein